MFVKRQTFSARWRFLRPEAGISGRKVSAGECAASLSTCPCECVRGSCARSRRRVFFCSQSSTFLHRGSGPVLPIGPQRCYCLIRFSRGRLLILGVISVLSSERLLSNDDSRRTAATIACEYWTQRRINCGASVLLLGSDVTVT